MVGAFITHTTGGIIMIKLTIEFTVNEQGQQIGLVSDPMVDVVAALGILEAAKLLVINGKMRSVEQQEEVAQ